MNWLPLRVSKLTVVFSVSPSSERSLTVLISAVLQGLTGKVRKNASNIVFRHYDIFAKSIFPYC